MTGTLPLRRKRQFFIFREIAKLGPYDEFPMTAPEIDPQIHLSRNDRDQPFFLICEKDCVVVQMSGRGRVVFRDSPLGEVQTEPGAFVYVPGGTPHRILNEEPGAQYRYKAREAGLEAVAWACPSCGAEVHREVWDTAVTLPQEGWLDACTRFNAQADLRACQACGAEHAPVDLAPYRWAAIAATLREQAREAAEAPA